MNTKDIVIGKKIMLLLVGQTGVGKTVQTASFRESGPGMIFDFDGKTASIKKVYPDADIEYETYGPREFKKFETTFHDLGNKCPYKWISVDSVTSLSISSVNYQMLVKGNEGKELKSGIVVPDWDEARGEARHFSKMLDLCKMLPCHVIFTAHPIKKMDGREEITALGYFSPRIIPAYFDEIFYIDKEEQVNASLAPIRVMYTSTHQGESRFGARTTLPLPSKIVLPDGNKEGLYQIIQKYLKEEVK